MLFFVGMGASNPILPQFVSDELGGSDTIVGIVAGSFAISSLLSRSLFGRLGDRRGARVLIQVGCVLGAVGMVAMVLASSVPEAIGARLILGAAQASAMTGATTLAIDLAPAERRGEASSYILVAFHLGLGSGPIIGESVLNRSSFDGVWWVLAVFMAGGAATAMLLPHRPGHPDQEKSPLLHRAGVAPGIVSSLAMTSFISFSFFVPLYAREINVDRVGPVFMVASISIALVRVVFGRVPDLLGPIRTGTMAISLIIAGSSAIAIWPTEAGLYLGTAVMSVGVALQTPAMIPIAVHGVEPHRRSSAMATFTMFTDVSVALTGPMMGLVASGAGYRATFVVAAMLAVVALLMLQFSLAPKWRVMSPDRSAVEMSEQDRYLGQSP